MSLKRYARGVGYNWSISYSDHHLRAEMEAYIRDYKPAVMLLFDRDGDQQDYVLDLAFKYGMFYPLPGGKIGYRPHGTFFVYRRWLPSDHNSNDGDNTQLWCSPARLCDMHMKLVNSGVPFLCNNEPNHPDLKRTSDWHIAVMKEAKRRGLRVAVGGYAYGHPENHLDYSVFDEMIREINRGNHILDIHEYVLGGTVFNDIPGAFDNERPETWPNFVPKEQRWRLGRFIWWMEHLKRKGIALPKMYIGEWGWATRPDMRHEWLRNVMSRWASSNRERFMAWQLQWAWRVLYQMWPNIIGVALFTLNNGGQWDFSNYLHFPEARRLMRQGFDTMQEETAAVAFTPKAVGYYAVLNSGGLNLRADYNLNSLPVLRVIEAGEVVYILEATAENKDGYWWQKVSIGGFTGWIAASIANLKLTGAPQPTNEKTQLVNEIVVLQSEIAARQNLVNTKLARLKAIV